MNSFYGKSFGEGLCLGSLSERDFTSTSNSNLKHSECLHYSLSKVE